MQNRISDLIPSIRSAYFQTFFFFAILSQKLNRFVSALQAKNYYNSCQNQYKSLEEMLITETPWNYITLSTGLQYIFKTDQAGAARMEC